MGTPDETLTNREMSLRNVVNQLSRDRKAKRPIALGETLFDAPQTPTEHVLQATIREVLENWDKSAFSGASDDSVPLPQK